MIYSAEQTTAIFNAIRSIELGNNGHADIGNDDVVGEAVRVAGYVVIKTKDLFGRSVLRGFTKDAQIALSTDGESTYKAVRQNAVGIDYEAAILARDERRFVD